MLLQEEYSKLMSYLGSGCGDLCHDWQIWEIRVGSFLQKARYETQFRPSFETMQTWLAAYHARVNQKVWYHFSTVKMRAEGIC